MLREQWRNYILGKRVYPREVKKVKWGKNSKGSKVMHNTIMKMPAPLSSIHTHWVSIMGQTVY